MDLKAEANSAMNSRFPNNCLVGIFQTKLHLHNGCAYRLVDAQYQKIRGRRRPYEVTRTPIGRKSIFIRQKTDLLERWKSADGLICDCKHRLEQDYVYCMITKSTKATTGLVEEYTITHKRCEAYNVEEASHIMRQHSSWLDEHEPIQVL